MLSGCGRAAMLSVECGMLNVEWLRQGRNVECGMLNVEWLRQGRNVEC